MKANILMPLKSPKTIETMIITAEMEKIEDNSAMSRKWDQPGVVGENDSCKKAFSNELIASGCRNIPTAHL